jgi:hypothetical protein
MKPYLAIPLFLLGAFVIDRGLGVALEQLSDRVTAADNPTGVAAGNWVLEQRHAELVVFGSSRAKHHFVPRVLERELGVATINAGIAARGIAFARMVQAEMLRRGTHARLFVLQLDPVELFDPARHRAVALAPWYGRNPAVDAILADSSRYAPIKLQSHAYRFNGKLLHLLLDLRKPPPGPDGGFVPLAGALTEIPPPRGRGALHHPLRGAIDDRRGDLHREFVRAARARGIEVVFVLGPRLRRADPQPGTQYAAAVAYFAELARTEGAHFIPLSDVEYPRFRDPGKYRDWLHLNGDGAAELSELLAVELRRRGLPAARAE